MTNCDFQQCTKEMVYLPFRCSYCGGNYCLDHRLPENHHCLFSQQNFSRTSTSKAPPISPQPPEEEEIIIESPEKDTTDADIDKELRNYIHTQERRSYSPSSDEQSTFTSRDSSPLFGPEAQKMKVTIRIMGLTVILTLLTLFSSIRDYLLINITVLFTKFTFFSLLTSMFTSRDLFSCIFALFFLFSLGRILEVQFGSKLVTTLYLLGGIIGMITVFVIQLICYFFFPALLSISISTQWAAISCLMVFVLNIVGLDREMHMSLYFIPIRLKPKYILYIILISNCVFAILGIFQPTIFPTLDYVAQIAGIITGHLYFKKHGRILTMPRFY